MFDKNLAMKCLTKMKHATGLDAGESRVNTLHSLCRKVMEYYLLNMYLKVVICHIIVAKSLLILKYLVHIH